MTHVARSLRHDCLVQLNTRILAGDARAEELRQDNSYVCAYCEHEERVFFRCGDNVRAHFAHTAGTQCWVESHEDWGRESADHLLAKFWLCNQIHIETGFATQIEAVVGERERIADILVLAAQCDARVAIEIQLAPISVEKLIERTESYIRNNVDVIWIVGEKNIGLFNQFKKHKKLELTHCKFYLVVFSEDEISICTLEKHNPHDPTPQRYMMMDILGFMLSRAKVWAASGAELSRLLHGQEIDVVSYERYLNYKNNMNRKVNPFDLIELDERQRMRMAFQAKRSEEDLKNTDALNKKIEIIKSNYESNLRLEKKSLSETFVREKVKGKMIDTDNFIMVTCEIIDRIKIYDRVSFIYVKISDPRRAKYFGENLVPWHARVSLKIYTNSVVNIMKELEPGRKMIVYGYIEILNPNQNKRMIWETHIIATGVDVL